MESRETGAKRQELRQQLSEKLRRHLGLHFPESRFDEMERRLEVSVRSLPDFAHGPALAKLLLADWDERIIDALVPNLSIGESYFFRDTELWKFFQNEMVLSFLRALKVDSRRRISIWSAACCTGEEPYTAAIALQRCLSSEQLKRFSILGTDVNKSFLSEAKNASYSAWSLRATPEDIKSGYFKEFSLGKFRVAESISGSVEFSYHNLMDLQHPSGRPEAKFDLILCRNVLIYFHPTQTAKVIAHLVSLLSENGYLVLSAHDKSYASSTSLAHMRFLDSALLCRRGGNDLAPKSKANTAESLKLSSGFTIDPAPSRSGTVTSPMELAHHGLYEEASKSIIAEIQQDEMTQSRLRFLVQCLCNAGKTQDAIYWCNEAIKSFPLEPQYYYLKGEMLNQQGSINAALSSYRQAIFLHGDFVLAHVAIYNTLLKQAKDAQAEISLQNAVRILRKMTPDSIVPESDGLSAAQLLALLNKTW